MSNDSETQSENDKNDDIECELNKLRLIYANSIIVIQIYLNSLPGKSDQLKFILTNKINILFLTETKLDETFNVIQISFKWIFETFKPFRLGRNQNGGGILVFFKNDIPSKLLTKHNLPDDI